MKRHLLALVVLGLSVCSWTRGDPPRVHVGQRLGATRAMRSRLPDIRLKLIDLEFVCRPPTGKPMWRARIRNEGRDEARNVMVRATVIGADERTKKPSGSPTIDRIAPGQSRTASSLVNLFPGARRLEIKYQNVVTGNVIPYPIRPGREGRPEEEIRIGKFDVFIDGHGRPRYRFETKPNAYDAVPAGRFQLLVWARIRWKGKYGSPGSVAIVQVDNPRINPGEKWRKVGFLSHPGDQPFDKVAAVLKGKGGYELFQYLKRRAPDACFPGYTFMSGGPWGSPRGAW